MGRDETDIARRLRKLEQTGLIESFWKRLGDRNVKVYRLKVEDLTQELGQIALQGPRAQEYLEKVLGEIPDIYFYQFFERDGMLISRTGYTGEDGFEIYADNQVISDLFQKFVDLGVQPCGLGARDTLRLEAGYPLYGNELTREVTPIEAGIGWTVKRNKDFIGKEGVLREPRWQTIGLMASDRKSGIARKGYKVFEGENEVGVVTSGTLSPTLNLPVAIVRVKVGEYTNLEVLIRNRRAEFKVTPLPFVPHRVRRKRKSK